MVGDNDPNRADSAKKAGHTRNRIRMLPPPGKAPYGYRRGKDKYIIDKSTAPVVREFFEHFLRFGSLRGAVRFLEKRFGKKIAVSTGRKWLTNPVYRGDLIYNTGEIITDTHAPIISRETAAGIDRLLRSHRKLPPKTASAKRSLAGLVFCGACESRFTVTKVKPKGKKTEYLYIRPLGCTREPHCQSLNYQRVLSEVINGICQQLPAEVAKLTLPNLEGIRNKILEEITHKEIIIERLLELEKEGILDEDSKNLRRYNLKTEIAQLQLQLDRLPPGELKTIVSAVSLPQFWQDLSEAERRFYFREFIQKIAIYYGDNGEYEVKIIFIFERMFRS
ncbi:MAG: hypothetical protein N5P05_000813 [Chroococcopsis gigantea SAG 12.99]|jgi:hypothetical protein|nr:recombinase family protein [Chlorogloea purpurea SAG 13.99]MDV2999207.1 hypothetical protein [Chroococcopsis gigantea SAG 12.99]